MTLSITVRLPADLHSRVRDAARDSDRSLSSEIVHRVRRSFAAPPLTPTLSPQERGEGAQAPCAEARR
jgi:hypothetical protein